MQKKKDFLLKFFEREGKYFYIKKKYKVTYAK